MKLSLSYVRVDGSAAVDIEKPKLKGRLAIKDVATRLFYRAGVYPKVAAVSERVKAEYDFTPSATVVLEVLQEVWKAENAAGQQPTGIPRDIQLQVNTLVQSIRDHAFVDVAGEVSDLRALINDLEEANSKLKSSVLKTESLAEALRTERDQAIAARQSLESELITCRSQLRELQAEVDRLKAREEEISREASERLLEVQRNAAAKVHSLEERLRTADEVRLADVAREREIVEATRRRLYLETDQIRQTNIAELIRAKEALEGAQRHVEILTRQNNSLREANGNLRDRLAENDVQAPRGI